MRKFTFIKSLFLIVALLVSSGLAYGQYTGAGAFTKITSVGDLTEGYYVVVNSGDGFAMNSSTAGKFFTHTAVTPATEKITNPEAAIVWKITPHVDGGFTIYSENTNKYVSYTGSSNEAYAVAAVTTGNQRWTVSYATGLFSFKNAVLTTRLLQYNSGAPRFACYTGSQQNLLLYKLAEASPTAASTPTIAATGTEKATDNYYNSAMVTLSSATEGAGIYYTTNGDVPTISSTAYSAAFEITSTTTIKALAVKAGLDNSAVAEKLITISTPATATVPYTEAFNNTLGDWVTFEVAGAKPWTASADGAVGNGYNGGDVESWMISPKFTAVGEGIALTFNYASKFTGDPLLVKMSANYAGYGDPSVATWTEISSIEAPALQDEAYTVKASGNLVAATTGTVYFALVYDADANYSDWKITNATVNNYTSPTSPTLTVTESEVPAMEAVAGLEDSETINVSGLALTADIIVTIDGADAAMFSVLPASIAQTAGEAAGTVTVTYSPTAPGTHTATLRFNSTDATEITRNLSGTSTLAVAVATAATAVNNTVFTANWNEVVGATDYEVSVYTKEGGEPVVVLSEDFSGFTKGAPDGGANSTDISASLDDYTQTTSWTGSKIYEAGGSAKMGGSSALGFITTPAIDLSGTGLTLTFKAMAWLNDATDMKVFLDDVLLYTATDLGNTVDYAFSDFSTPITGGTASSKIRFEGSKASKGRFFIDDVVISTGGSSNSPITGSPFTITGATEKAITGLTTGTTYYYTVVAKNATIVSAASNEVSVTTGPATGLSTATQALNMRTVNGHILFNSEAGQTVEVYNSLGQKLVQGISTEGLNSIAVNVKGIVLVKINNEVVKLIAK